MEDRLYLRKCKLLVETWGGETIEVSELRFTFRIEKRINDYLWFGDITVYNLNRETETALFKNGKSLILEAGYENGPYGQIFSARIRQAIRGKENGTDYYLKFACVNDLLSLGFCNMVLSEGQTAEAIINQIARSSSVPFEVRVELPHGGAAYKTQRGKVVFGSPADELRSIAANNQAFMYVDDAGVVNISPLSKTPPAIVPELNADTGLIGFPQQTDHGVQFRCLINPDFRIDSWVKLNNQQIIQAQVGLFDLQTLLDIDGLYRIIEQVIFGDSRGNDWYYDIVAISQAGSVPQMLTIPSQGGL